MEDDTYSVFIGRQEDKFHFLTSTNELEVSWLIFRALIITVKHTISEKYFNAVLDTNMKIYVSYVDEYKMKNL